MRRVLSRLRVGAFGGAAGVLRDAWGRDSPVGAGRTYRDAAGSVDQRSFRDAMGRETERGQEVWEMTAVSTIIPDGEVYIAPRQH